MNTTLCENWTGFAASIPGSGHIRRGLPCQDASAAVLAPRPALIVCDGRGSAACSDEGAQAAVRVFRSQAAVFEPMLAGALDEEAPSAEPQWEMFARIMYRTLMQAKLDLSAVRGLPEKEFDFTVAFAVVGTRRIGCFQVGDGAIVLRQQGRTLTAFLPDKGEYANQTHFLREGGEAKGAFHAALFPAAENTGIVVTSDGPEHLMFQLAQMKPGRVFDKMMDDLHDNQLCRQDIMDYLTRREWENDPRGGDDRSLAILVPITYAETEPTPVSDAPAAINPPTQTASAEPVAPADPTEVAEPTAPVAPAEPSAPAEPTEPAGLAAPVESAAPAEPTEPSAPAEPTEPSAPAESTEPVELAEPSAPAVGAVPADDTSSVKEKSACRRRGKRVLACGGGALLVLLLCVGAVQEMRARENANLTAKALRCRNEQLQAEVQSLDARAVRAEKDAAAVRRENERLAAELRQKEDAIIELQAELEEAAVAGEVESPEQVTEGAP